MLYVLDTSAIIDAWREWYSPEIISRLWDDLEELANNSVITIPEAVLLELEPKDDDLYKWCKSREDTVCVPTTPTIQDIVTRISNDYPNLSKGGLPPSKNFADPFVIAVSIHYQSAVVSHEGYSNDMSGPKIGDLCRDLGIRKIRFASMVKELGLSFN